MKILHVTSEVTPLFKFGGLGDVSGSLTKELKNLGHDVRIILPAHPEISLSDSSVIASQKIIYDREELWCTVHLTYLAGTTIPVYLVENGKYISKDTQFSQNHADKYAVFCMATTSWLKSYSWWQPDIIHLNDWHTSLVPITAKHIHKKPYTYVLTIHNLGYEGNTNTNVVQKLGIPHDACKILSWDNDDNHYNLLMEGIAHSDHITTVSPQYKKEILDGMYKNQSGQVLIDKKDAFTGIINGIDVDYFNPSNDIYIDHRYSLESAVEGKKSNRKDLLKKYFNDLPQSTHVYGFVGRVDGEQKGIDTIINLFNDKEFTAKLGAWIFLGTGDPVLEKKLHAAAKDHPHVVVVTRFDEALAREIYASSEVMFIPSSYEPCGLVQLIAQRYGAIPVATKTGGFIDTISDDKTGILIPDNSINELKAGLLRAQKIITSTKDHYSMVHNMMSLDLGWSTPASEYEKLFESLKK